MYNNNSTSVDGSHISPPISVIVNESDDGFMKFKLYDNVKSRPIPPEELRGKFNSYKDYLLHCLSLTGSLPNLMRFPYLAYTYDGSSFLAQFLILVVLIGVPWCFMETALGQYSGRGPTAIGDMVPIGKGVAAAMGYICLLNVICYSPIQSRCLLYMYRSVSENTLPWSHCPNQNHTECIDEFRNMVNSDSKSVGIELTVPAESFYLGKIINMDQSILYDGLSTFYVPLLYCLGISWIVNFFLLIASNKFMKYVQIFGSITPFVLIFLMLVVIILTTNNAWAGFYTLFDASKIDLLNIQSWRRAAEQVLYSLDVGTGHLIIYGRNCDFRNNLLGDILIVTLLDVICAVAATLVIFGTANNISCKYHKVFQSVFKFGPGMFFISISQAVSYLPFPRISSFLAFFVIFVVCIITQLSFLKPIIYLLNVYFTQYNIQHHSYYCAGILCVVMFGLSLITVTRDGELLISLLDDIGSTMGILVIATFEAILIFGIYGINEFCADLAFMTDHPPSIILKILFIAGPVFIINIFLACSCYWIPPSFQNIPYPTAIYVIAWVMAILTLVIIAVSAIHTIIQFSRNKNFSGAFEPTDRWVPDLIYSLNNNQLNSMTDVRKELTYDNANNLTFGIGKPRLSIKIDQATQTNEENYTYLDDISNQRFQHFYLELLNSVSNKYELLREHNENEVMGLDDTGYVEHLIDNGVLEKYVQTD